MANYANITQSTQTGTTGGYKPILFFAPIADIVTWGRPIANPVALGDKVKVNTAHIFAATKAAMRWELKLHSAKATSKVVGDEGAQEMEHTLEVEFLGDNPATFEQVQNMLNDQIVVWTKDANCQDDDGYVQYGDDCVPTLVTPEFDSKTTKDGKKTYKVTFTTKKKLFYLAALDIDPGV